MASKVTYQDAGVDTRAAAALVCDIKADVARTQKQRQLFNSFGLFAAAFDLSDYSEPVIVTGCDGVGTKVELLLEHGMEAEAGKDLIAMSVNDIITTGGDPLLFLDYIGIAKLDPPRIKKLISGMCDYLEDCGCILAGGETAEMPGIVPPDVVELSGFCIENEYGNDFTNWAAGSPTPGGFAIGDSFADWALAAGVSDPNADPDGDGRSNLFEYAFDSDPMTPNNFDLLSLEIFGGNVTAAYDSSILKPDLNVNLESSVDLEQWAIKPTQAGADVREAKLAQELKAFFRLRISQKP
ncbi:AIR synthase related protein [Akkermansiaceae bacterium]|nr:AIR synthase related protein [Akkermansiaceae bacterium]